MQYNCDITIFFGKIRDNRLVKLKNHGPSNCTINATPRIAPFVKVNFDGHEIPALTALTHTEGHIDHRILDIHHIIWYGVAMT